MFPGNPVNEETLAPVAQRDPIQFTAQPLRMDKNGRPIWRGLAVSDDDSSVASADSVFSVTSVNSATSAQKSAHLPPAGGRAERKLRIKRAEETIRREPAGPAVEPVAPVAPVAL